MTYARSLLGRIRRYYRSKSIQLTISVSFSLVAVICMVIMGMLLYTQFTQSLRQTIVRENQQIVNQIGLNINNYITRMRGISNSIYYSVIKKYDLAEQSISRDMSLMYEANTGALVSIALYDEEGTLIAAVPNANAKPNVDVREQGWFQQANTVIENPHFSTPHVENLFLDSSQRHHYVISLSRMVELLHAGVTSRGVLLVDMDFSGIEMIFQQMGADAAGYVYLVDPSGEIVYHPKQQLIYSGLFQENSAAAAGYADGVRAETFAGVERQVIVKTVSFTGWKLICVIPHSEFSISFQQVRNLMVAVFGLTIFLILSMNMLISSRIADPIKKLDESVRALEEGSLDLNVYVGGPHEIEHLGKTIRKTVTRMRELMEDIVEEQERLRKSEFDALQAQINPHFLYNTLDSIVWMIESERHREAISMVTALASLFRIALSRGSNIIPIRTEIQYAQHYLHIQNIRYRNTFTVTYEIDPEIEGFMTIKLIIQPILENAIYHAMELMDGEGRIAIRGYREGGDILLEIIDNGLGMTAERCASLLTDDEAVRASARKGAGIGLRNVHQRLRLYYGDGYGLTIHSELDVGTTVRIRLPVIQPDDAEARA